MILLVLLLLALLAVSGFAEPGGIKKANFVFILTDDQDRRLGSTEYQPVLQREMIDKGTEFTNHFATVAQCCPSRASLLRGQAGHNTNITHVSAPGGNYDKFVLAGEDNDYLPFWLKMAGYRTEYLGKFLNGYNTLNYAEAPKGWDYVDCLVDPYTYAYNTVVMSENGKTPVFYDGYHQTDVLRVKAISRLEHLANQDLPFYLTIAPTSPHVTQHLNEITPPVPLVRHIDDFPNATTPKLPNYNPPDELQVQKRSWIKSLPLMNNTQIEFSDTQFRSRIRSLQGIDEVLEDVLATLNEYGILEQTYVIYTSDNGYHLGNYRVPAGKALPFADDTNLPFVVRGPNIPAGVTSELPGSHIDLAPTILDIADLPHEQYPPFLDGRSLLDQWENPTRILNGSADGLAREMMNIEFWGSVHFEAPPYTLFENNSYKTLRLVGDNESWLFIKWCTNEAELYNTNDDPYELHNLADSPSSQTIRLLDRLNAILLVTKSCSENVCRDPWSILQPTNSSSSCSISTLKEAMHPRYDTFFASFPNVAFKECMQYQDAANEEPYYPLTARELQQQYRQPTDNFVSPVDKNFALPWNGNLYGGADQRNLTLAMIMLSARNLTAEELEPDSA